jgi:hypothetical protein
MTETATVKLDPRRELVNSIITHALNYSDDASEQTVADMVMAMMIMCELSGLDQDDVQAMVDAGQDNALRAAARIRVQIEFEDS